MQTSLSGEKKQQEIIPYQTQEDSELLSKQPNPSCCLPYQQKKKKVGTTILGRMRCQFCESE